MEQYQVVLHLDDERLPDESSVIRGLIENGTLMEFVYAVVNDVIEGRYDISATQNKIVLDQLIDTVGSIFETVSSMDVNISDLTSSLNQHTELLEGMRKSPTFTPPPPTHTPEPETQEQLEETPIEAVAEMEIEIDDGEEGGLELMGDFDDLFSLDFDS